ncbi:glucokinase [Syntrophobotulus glycolicus DSM 8271]|uniref:Glucokinase n=1 Tax=Syntrophobotulus glycolicus (strain DSM 8271 / FlGlyR) TaxID=645991 RepID=F0T0L8_SYNGF|nr:glucokinase [Syntrophobotulus glycolicus]ADY55083.1 glucokinase [Syntrophobotulus glycolicus DSM 8271]
MCMILTGDIGGTKTKFALFSWEDQQFKLIHQERVESKSISSLEDAVAGYLAGNHPGQSAGIEAAWFSLAGPIAGNSCRLTNLDLTVDLRSLQKRLDFIPRVGWSNDLVAMGYGIAVLPEDALLRLNGPGKQEDDRGEILNRAVLAPGTGLGEALMIGDQVYPTEGAHTDFAPHNEEDLELWRYLHRRYGHVSYERILSGAGLSNLYQFLRAQKKSPEQLPDQLPPEEISAKGLARSCPVCTKALDMFVRLLGAEAGNLALKSLALGGVYLGGGIPPKIREKLTDGTLLAAFLDKGRFSRLLKDIPVDVILEENTPLLGAAYLALQAQR